VTVLLQFPGGQHEQMKDGEAFTTNFTASRALLRPGRGHESADATVKAAEAISENRVRDDIRTRGVQNCCLPHAAATDHA